MKEFDVVLTNPPFGTKTGGERATRDDITYTTSNKQLNFLQTIYNSLNKNGNARAAVIVPGNVLFEDGVGESIRRDLLNKCNLHTILRLPSGIFYEQGVMTNVLFFTRGKTEKNNTENIWIYDMRSNMRKFGKTNPLTILDFEEFKSCYNAGDLSNCKETYSEENPNGRFRKYTIENIENRSNFNLDITWIEKESDTPDISMSEMVEQIKYNSQKIKEASEKLLESLGGIDFD